MKLHSKNNDDSARHATATTGQSYTHQDVDNRPETVQLKMLQELSKCTPGVKQFNKIKEMANRHAARQSAPLRQIALAGMPVLQPVWILTAAGPKWVEKVDLSKFEDTGEVAPGDGKNEAGPLYRARPVDKEAKKSAKVERNKKGAERQQVQGLAGPPIVKDVSDDVLKISTPYALKGGTSVFRITDGLTARQYVLNGLPTTIHHKDKDEWLQLGPGFYASPNPNLVKHYASKMGQENEGLKRFEIRGLPVMLEIAVTQNAKGIQLDDPEKAGIDGGSYAKMKQIIDTYDCIFHDDNVDPAQIKFHGRFMGALKIVACHVKSGDNNYIPYTPEVFVKDFEKYLIDKHKDAAVAAEKKRQPVPAWQPPDAKVQGADAAPEWMNEAILYSELAAQFEHNLGIFCMHVPRAQQAVQQLVRCVWGLFKSEEDLLKFGAKQPGGTGMVWPELAMLKKVVDSGNIREQMSLLYNGYTSRLFETLNGGKELVRHELFQKEREEEKPTGLTDKKTNASAMQVQPPLSDSEWLSSVNKDGQLNWVPGEKVREFPMNTRFQKMAENIGALVMTGTSGTAYGILQSAQLIGDKGGIKPDLLGIRIALLGWMMSARDHTYHEVMTACALFDPAVLPYQDGFRRYRHIAPFTEDELRNHVAPERVFPDEVTKELREI